MIKAIFLKLPLPHILIVSIIVFSLFRCGGGGGSGGGLVESTAENPVPSPETSSVTLEWDAPTSNADGSPLNDLAGYKVYYGNSSTNYTNSVDIGNFTSATINDLSSGTWYFAVTAYDASGNESSYSNEVSLII